jgi:hypothetical protein
MCAKIFCRVLVMVVGGITLTAVAGTNSVPQFTRLLIFPEPHLRAEFEEPSLSRKNFQQHEMNSSSSPAEIRSAHLETQHSDSFILVSRGDRDFQQYQHFDIIEPVREPDDRLSRCLDSIFRPEEFHVGKTIVSCSILTAIKRKDPLCLLNVNPYFLKISW